MTKANKPTTETSQAPIMGVAAFEAVMPLKREDQSLQIAPTISDDRQSEAPDPAGDQPGMPLPTTVTGNAPDAQEAAITTAPIDHPDSSLAGDLQRLRLATMLDELASRKTVRIMSPRDFRRAGMRHLKGITEYPIDNFTAEQLEMLHRDPDLSVEYI